MHSFFYTKEMESYSRKEGLIVFISQEDHVSITQIRRKYVHTLN